MFYRKKSYNTLYIDILKIGKKRVEDGLSYNILKRKLREKGYNLDGENNCIELAAKEWFFDSFHHRGDDLSPVDVEHFEGHHNCNFVMKGDACLKLIEYKSSRRNIFIACIAAFIAALAFIYVIYHDRNTKNVVSTNTQKSQVRIVTQYIISQ
jgi:hypothetical protein